jgi:hypothetical protein
MKNAAVQLALVLIAITSIHAVRLLQTTAPHTHAYPPTDTERDWAVHNKDSLRMIGIYFRAEQ